jgi:hypothetical protein
VPEINLNFQFAELLQSHDIHVAVEEEFIKTDLPDNAKFKARTIFQETKNGISSRLDVMAVTNKGERIVECCGDFGATIEEAVERNFQNFSASSLHPLLASLGCLNPYTYEQITIEEWTIHGKLWKVYIGNLVPKIIANEINIVAPPAKFFDLIENGIRIQKLTNRLHWFRSYYSQLSHEITEREFLMDNEPVSNTDEILRSLPIIYNVKFFSCRNFIVLKNISPDGD